MSLLDLINGWCDTSEHYGTTGPIQIKLADSRNWKPTSYLPIDGFKELGFKEVDYNSPDQEGISFIQSNVDAQGERCSTAKAYLRPNMHRRNLHVATNAHVTKV